MEQEFVGQRDITPAKKHHLLKSLYNTGGKVPVIVKPYVMGGENSVTMFTKFNCF